MSEPLRVFIIDEHEDVRRALAARLNASPCLAVVGDEGDAEAALLAVHSLRPDVVLLETKRSDGRGLEIVSWIALSDRPAAVFILTSYPSEWEHWAARRAGAAHYFLKDIDSDQLISHLLAAGRDRAGMSARAILHPHG
jgi:DNA-binding NarL/FixJ family response regulator